MPFMVSENGTIANLSSFQIPLGDSGGTTGFAGSSASLESSVFS